MLDGEDKGKPLQFGSWEERCNACQIYGGEQEPCCTEAVRREIERQHGRPCPRILLDPWNVELVNLANMAIADSPLLPMMLEAATAGMDPEETQEAIHRVEAVRSHPLVTAALERAKERAAREAAANRGHR